MNSTKHDIQEFAKFLVVYQSKKTKTLAFRFEGFKNSSVEILMAKRGRFQKQIWHSSMIGLASVGVLTSTASGNGSLVADSFSEITGQDPRVIQAFDPNASGVSLSSLLDFKTDVSEKPRSEIIEYEVESGETVSQIAQKFGISVDTIKWANDLSSVNNVKPGDKLKILPVSGVSVTVKSGDTLESLAKKYGSSAEAILQYPFNDVAEDLSIKAGQSLIIPDGEMPDSSGVAPKRSRIIPPVSGSVPSGTAFQAPGGGSFAWPTTFQMISTYFAWWHPGIDVASNAAPPIVATDGGTIIFSGYDPTGYGNRVDIDHGNGYTSRYAHLSNIYVTEGQKVSRGQRIGQMGSTGRSTGIHLHFEIRYKGIAVNPLAILK